MGKNCKHKRCLARRPSGTVQCSVSPFSLNLVSCRSQRTHFLLWSRPRSGSSKQLHAQRAASATATSASSSSLLTRRSSPGMLCSRPWTSSSLLSSGRSLSLPSTVCPLCAVPHFPDACVFPVSSHYCVLGAQRTRGPQLRLVD